MADADLAAVADADPAASGWKMAVTTVWAKVKYVFVYLTTKDYESTMGNATKKQLEADRNTRLRGYLRFSSLGFGAMCWGGATKVLDHAKDKHPEHVSYCVIFLAFAFLSQLIGLIAATFPKTCPWSFFFAGLGAWQSAVFVLAIFHLNVVEYYTELRFAEYSMIATSAVLSFYWSIGPQDPMFLHILGKLLIGTVYILWILICWSCFLVAKVAVFAVWFPLYLLSFLWRCRGNIGKSFTKGPGSQGILPRLRWHIRSD